MNHKTYLGWVSRLRGFALRRPIDRDDLKDVLEYLAKQLPEHEEKIARAEAKTQEFEFGGQCFVPLERDDRTGVIVLEYAYGNVWSPLHRHGRSTDPSEPGEIVDTYDGLLLDRHANGSVITHRVGDPSIVHLPGSIHQPLIYGGWVGSFWHPVRAEDLDLEKLLGV